jgi:hypothetical protein
MLVSGVALSPPDKVLHNFNTLFMELSLKIKNPVQALLNN